MGWKKGSFSSSRQLAVAASAALVAALLPTCPALGQTPAPADDAVFLNQCVTDDDRAAAAAGGKHQAFRQSSIPLGPFFWATADRELVQAMMVYWRILDVEEGTRLTLVLPLFVDHCAPDARTWMGPFGLWGGQTDVAGTAGWWGPYFYRRDKAQQSDVLFPLLWSFRDEQESTQVIGPYFNAHRPEHDVFGFVPLYLGYRDRTEGFFDLAPGYVRWGRGPEHNTVLLQTWHSETAQTETTLSVPFWLSHEDRTDDSWLQLAPGFASWGDADTSTLVAGPWYARSTPHGSERGLLPLLVTGEATSTEHRGALDLLGIEPDKPYRYTLIPPLLFGHVADDEGSATWLAQTRIEHRPGRSSIWSAPFVFHARDDDPQTTDYTVVPPLAFVWLEDKPAKKETLIAGPWVDIDSPTETTRGVLPFWLGNRSKVDSSYFDVVPPLAFARWGDDNAQQTLLAQTLYMRGDRGWSLWSFPFAFVGHDEDLGGANYAVVPPLAFAHLDVDDHSWTLAGTGWLFDTPSSFSAGVLPIFGFGRELDDTGAPREGWELVPPLLTWHRWDRERSQLVAGPLYRFRDRDGLHQGLAPLYFQGRNADGSRYDVAPLGLTALYSDEENTFAWMAQTVFWRNQRTRDYHLTSLPLLSVGRSGDARHAVVPGLGFAHWGDGDADHTLLLNTYAYRYNRRAAADRQGSAVVSPPFYFGSRSPDGAYADVIPTLGFARWGNERHQTLLAGPYLDVEWREGERSIERLQVLPPVLFRFRGERRDITLVPGAAWWGREADEEATRHLLVGQTYASWTERSWSAASVPFYFGHSDDETGDFAHVVPPLATAWWKTGATEAQLITGYFDIEDDEGSDQGFFPLYMQGTSKPEHGTTPLTELGRSWMPTVLADAVLPRAQHRRAYRLAPGYLHLEHDAVTTDIVGQTYWHQSADGEVFGSAPLYHGARGPDGAYLDVMPPLLFARHSDGVARRLWWGPWLSFDDDEANEHAFALLPVAMGQRNDQGSWLLTPAGGAWGDGQHLNLWIAQTLFAGDDDGWIALSAPLYAGLRDDKRGQAVDLIPVLGVGRARQGTRQATLIGPWARVSDSARGESLMGLAPLFVAHRAADKASVLTPVGAWWREGRQSGYWFAQTWGERSDDGWSFATAPLYFGSEKRGGGYHVIPPLAFARAYNAAGDHVSITGPVYDVKSGSRTWRGVLPLYASAASDAGGFTMAPGFWHRWDHTRDSSDTWLLNTHVTTDRDLWSVASHPLYYGGGGGPEGDYHHFVPAVLAFAWGRQQRGEHRLVIGPLFSLEQPTGTDRGFAPLWMSGEGTAAGSLMSPMVAAAASSVFGDEVTRTFEDPSGFHYAMAPGFFTVANAAGDRRALLAGQTFVYKSADAWKAWSAPFYFGAEDATGGYHVLPPLLSGHAHDEASGSHATVVAPLAYASWGDRRAQTTLAGPWFDHQATQATGEKTSIRGLAPVWLDAREDDRFLQAYSPLFWRWGDDDAQRALGPGIWYAKDKSSADLIVFPFYWDIERPSFDVTMAGGVYWRFGWRKDRGEGADRSLLLTPGYARYEDEDETLHVAGPVAFSGGKGQHKDAWAVHLGPALSLYSYHADHFRWKALMGVLGYEREGDTEQFTFFFVKTPPTQRTSAAAPRARSSAPPS
jgi:hypothetical protein